MVPLDVRQSSPEIENLIRHSGASVVIGEERLFDLVADDLDAGLVRVALALDGGSAAPDYEHELAIASSVDPYLDLSELDSFGIFYTSGTTGRPKGVEISHRSRCLTFLAAAAEYGWGPRTRSLAVAPLYLGGGFTLGYGALYAGSSLVILRSFDPERFLYLVDSSQTHSTFLVPTHAHMIRSLGERTLERFPIKSLKTLMFNAAPLPVELKTWVLERWPSIDVHEFYGSTEASIVANLRPADQRRKLGSVGPPWQLTEVSILDNQRQPVLPGEVGELFSRSPYLMSGYWTDSEATAAATTAEGFFSAGDLARADDESYLYIVGRIKDMIITGGTNVYPIQVEEVLRDHPSVMDVAVAGVPSQKWGEEVAAFVVLRAGQNMDEEGLRRHCRVRLATYEVPKRFVSVATLPRNSNGKVLRRQLVALAIGAGAGSHSESELQ